MKEWEKSEAKREEEAKKKHAGKKNVNQIVALLKTNQEKDKPKAEEYFTQVLEVSQIAQSRNIPLTSTPISSFTLLFSSLVSFWN